MNKQVNGDAHKIRGLIRTFFMVATLLGKVIATFESLKCPCSISLLFSLWNNNEVVELLKHGV